jgi:hypothetical protein
LRIASSVRSISERKKLIFLRISFNLLFMGHLVSR